MKRARMAELANEIRTLEDALSACNRCGMCQAVCPVFTQTGREADVARGKLALLDGLTEQLFSHPKETAQRLQRCLLCGACQRYCSSGVQSMDIFIKARAILAEFLKLSPFERTALRKVLARPERFHRMTRFAARHQDLLTRPAPGRPDMAALRFGASRFGNRRLPRLPEHPFREGLTGMNTAPGKDGLKIAFFPGCLLDNVFPQTARNAVKVLTAAGHGVFIPQGLGCCGIPALAAGETDTALSLLAHNLELLAQTDFDVLLTACATCTFTIKERWPRLPAEGDSHLKEQAEEIAKKTTDLLQFLGQQKQLPIQAAKENSAEIVTYHDPCHLKKSLNVFNEPRRLLKETYGKNFVEMPGADQCCGMGGSFNLHYYDLSAAIAARKRENILSTSCTTVATGCPACMLQLTDSLAQAGSAVQVKHVVDLLAQGL